MSDFFASDTDFVQSVERLPEHIGTRAGETNQILIESDLDNPQAWADISDFILALGDDNALARDAKGLVQIGDPNPVDILARTTAMADEVKTSTGMRPIDLNDNGIPDEPDQVAATWTHVLTTGVAGDDGTELFSPAEVATVIDFSEEQALLATAGSTAIGYAILGLTPMPLFATFRLPTALMVLFALLATLVVLTVLLGIVARDDMM